MPRTLTSRPAPKPFSELSLVPKLSSFHFDTSDNQLDMSRSLWACGFNAHGQLTGEDVEDLPHDVYEPRRLLIATSIRILFLGWADTLRK